MIDWLTQLPEESLAYALIMAVVGLLSLMVKQWWTHRGAKELALISADTALEKGTQEMALALLSELRRDLQRIRDENHDLRNSTQAAIARAKVLTRHLEAVLGAETPDDRVLAEKAAKEFLEQVSAVF